MLLLALGLPFFASQSNSFTFLFFFPSYKNTPMDGIIINNMSLNPALVFAALFAVAYIVVLLNMGQKGANAQPGSPPP